MGYRPVSSKLITIRLRAVPFNIKVVQAYAPTSDYDEIENIYDQLQNVIDQTPKKDIVVRGDWNAKVGKDACENCQAICGPLCNDNATDRGLRPLKFATFTDLVFVSTFGHHETSRRQTLHSPNKQHHNQINFILARKHFRSGVNIGITRSFPEADIGSAHDFLMMTFHLRRKGISKPKHTRLKFDLKMLKDPIALGTFQAIIGGKKFAPLKIINNKDK